MLDSTANITRLSPTGRRGTEVARTVLSGVAFAGFATQFLADDSPQCAIQVLPFLRLSQRIVNLGLLEALAGLNAALGGIR